MASSEAEPARGVVAEQHVPVLLGRVAELLAPALQGRPALAVDATLGLGGHAAALLGAHPQLRLIGLDRDPAALRIAGERLAGFGDRAHLVHTGFEALERVLGDLDVPAIDAALFDLGVSSMQLDSDERGFAYSRDTPLDMRMDPTATTTAADVVNGYDARALARVFRQYGEERFADRIARRIVAERAAAPFESTGRLAELVRESIPAAARRTGGHPAKRVFQALRIEVNDELGQLRRGLDAALDALALDGRVVVLSYQSLEDRIVKQTFAARSRDQQPLDLPIPAAQSRPELELLTRGAEKASAQECAANPRATSVRLRAVRRLRVAA